MFISLFLRSCAVIAGIVLTAEVIYKIVLHGRKNPYVDDKED